LGVIHIQSFGLVMQHFELHPARGSVLCIARQGIYINREEDRQARFIARRAFIFLLIGFP
jgi:hypothetical protein